MRFIMSVIIGFRVRVRLVNALRRDNATLVASLADAERREREAIDAVCDERHMRLIAEARHRQELLTSGFWQARAFDRARELDDAETHAATLRLIASGEIRWTPRNNDAQA